jgi:hypothetical protein
MFAPDTVRAGYQAKKLLTQTRTDGASEAPQVGSRHDKTAEREPAASEPRSASDKVSGGARDEETVYQIPIGRLDADRVIARGDAE